MLYNDVTILRPHLAEMACLRILIDAEQEEIELLIAENRELRAEIRAILTTLKVVVLI